MKDPHDAQALITRLEGLSKTNPAAYRFRVALVAMLGYAYLVGVVVGMLAFVYIAVYMMIFLHQLNFLILKVVWIPLVLAWLVIKSMWVSVPPPDGKELQAEQAPELFKLIAEIQTTLSGPGVNHVLLSDEFNASIVQVPKFGMFGWTSNYLVLGLPLMKALGPAEFRSVLAHEFGHLSGKHGRFTGWIYQLRQSWIQILTQVKMERHYASFLFERFLDWYAPYFNAYTFVLARAQEYEADSYSVELAGPEVAARALVQLDLKARVLGEEFWPDLYRQANDSAQPPKSPFALMLEAAQSPIPELKAEKLLRHSIKIKTGYDDTHPAMAERLNAIGIDASSFTNEPTLLKSVVSEQNDSAAERYLNLIPEDVLKSFDRLWVENIKQSWYQRHQTIQEMRKRLDELEQKRQQQPLSLDEQWERVRCFGEIHEPSAAVPMVKEILDQQPEHVKANWVLGAVLLEQSDPGGIQYVKKAMQLDASATGAGCELIYDYYRAQGKPEEAETYRLRAEQYYDALQRHHEQAMNLSAYDPYEPHGLDPLELAEVQAQLKGVSGLATAYLVRKPVAGAPEPLYVMAVLAYPVFVNGRSQKDIPGLLNNLGTNLVFTRSLVFVSLDAKAFLTNPIKQVAGSQIYSVK